MCAVSAVTDYYREKWPMPQYPYEPIGILPKDWLEKKQTYIITKEQWEEYQELKRRMQAYDLATGQPHCEKPEVEVWEEVIKQFVEK